MLVLSPAKALQVEVQYPCMGALEMANKLKTFKERPIWVGVSTNGHRAVMWGDPANSTWTLILINFEGQACIIVSGESWAIIEQDEGEPT